MALEENRVTIEVELIGRNGRHRRSRAFVDTGGAAFSVTEAVARELELPTTGLVDEEGTRRFASIVPPTVMVGDLPIALGQAKAVAIIGDNAIVPASGVEAFIPAPMLMGYDVVFDYPARTFTIALPGNADFRGPRVQTPVLASSGYARIEATIDGATHGFLLDTGGAYTMISAAVLREWSDRHPDWPTMVGAVGEANMIGKHDVGAPLVRVPRALVGGFTLADTGMIGRPKPTYENYDGCTAPVIGALAGNALRDFRVGIDYLHGVTYLEQQPTRHDGDLDSPGFVLDISYAGEVRIADFAQVGGVQVATGAQVGDRLLSVDGLNLSNARRASIFGALHGRPGEVRSLRLLRDGSTVLVDAPVRHLL